MCFLTYVHLNRIVTNLLLYSSFFFFLNTYSGFHFIFFITDLPKLFLYTKNIIMGDLHIYKDKIKRQTKFITKMKNNDQDNIQNN